MKALALVAAVALVALPRGVGLVPSVRFEFTDCAAAGSASQTVTANTYLLRVTDADVWLCYAATCASGGERLQAGTVMPFNVGPSSVMSCRSSASTGDLVLTKAN